ncbi:unnamed protein product [marine sediment metagenome]|uniref:Uncharacterized protein n=1 Tax=marine sediment metagenome TaxID=412755 RepID=X1GUD8_9ZZZZ
MRKSGNVLIGLVKNLKYLEINFLLTYSINNFIEDGEKKGSIIFS